MKRMALTCALALLAGCASSVRNPAGQRLAQGEVVASPVATAVRVGSKANLLHQGKRLKFDVWIEADSSKGRLDALGPFGTPLATVIWADSSWQAWLPGQSTLLRGTGPAVNLPVLGLKDIRPANLVAPLLGRVLPPTSKRVKTVAAGKGEVLVLPAVADPTWSLMLDASTGLPKRRQFLKAGRETEGLTFHDWKRHGKILVPGTIDRTTPDGQLLQLEQTDWSELASVPDEHLQLRLKGNVDTITLARNERGQTVYRIRAAGANGGDTTSVVISGPHGFGDAPLEDTTSTGPALEEPLDSSAAPEDLDSLEEDQETDPPMIDPSKPVNQGSETPNPPKAKESVPAATAPESPLRQRKP